MTTLDTKLVCATASNFLIPNKLIKAWTPVHAFFVRKSIPALLFPVGACFFLVAAIDDDTLSK